jgi:hypothetical protein
MDRDTASDRGHCGLPYTELRWLFGFASMPATFCWFWWEFSFFTLSRQRWRRSFFIVSKNSEPFTCSAVPSE